MTVRCERAVVSDAGLMKLRPYKPVEYSLSAFFVAYELNASGGEPERNLRF